MSTPHRSLCPREGCGRLAVREVINQGQTTATITEVTYLCPRGHNWITRWHHEPRREAS